MQIIKNIEFTVQEEDIINSFADIMANFTNKICSDCCDDCAFDWYCRHLSDINNTSFVTELKNNLAEQV